MKDFFVWFLTKHTLVSAVLFPELTFAWSVWMEKYRMSFFLGAYVFMLHGQRFLRAVTDLVWIYTPNGKADKSF